MSTTDFSNVFEVEICLGSQFEGCRCDVPEDTFRAGRSCQRARVCAVKGIQSSRKISRRDKRRIIGKGDAGDAQVVKVLNLGLERCKVDYRNDNACLRFLDGRQIGHQVVEDVVRFERRDVDEVSENGDRGICQGVEHQDCRYKAQTRDHSQRGRSHRGLRTPCASRPRGSAG